MAPKVVDKEKKKREILLAAMRVYAEKGARNARVADVAVAAGIGKGTIYEYFRSRNDILTEAFHLVIADVEKGFIGVMQSTDDPETRLKQITRVSFESFLQFPADIVEIYLDFWSEGIRQGDVEGRLGINLKSMYEQFRTFISTVLDDGITSGVFRPMNTRLVASTLMATIDGLLLQLIADRDAFDQSRMADEIIDLFLEGLRSKPQ